MLVTRNRSYGVCFFADAAGVSNCDERFGMSSCAYDAGHSNNERRLAPSSTSSNMLWPSCMAVHRAHVHHARWFLVWMHTP